MTICSTTLMGLELALGRRSPRPAHSGHVLYRTISGNAPKILEAGECYAESRPFLVVASSVLTNGEDNQNEAVTKSEGGENNNRAGMIMPRWACAVATLAALQVMDLEDGGDARQGWLLATRRVPWTSTAFGRAAGWPQSKTSASCCIKAAGLASAVKMIGTI